MKLANYSPNSFKKLQKKIRGSSLPTSLKKLHKKVRDGAPISFQNRGAPCSPHKGIEERKAFKPPPSLSLDLNLLAFLSPPSLSLFISPLTPPPTPNFLLVQPGTTQNTCILYRTIRQLVQILILV